MTNFLEFAILGLALASAYVLLGNGLVLIYRGSGVLNFAHGAYAMAAAYVFYEFDQVDHWPFLASFVVAVAFAGVIGFLTHVLVMRPLRNASPLARLIATLGILLLIEGVATLRYGANYLMVPSSMPKAVYRVDSVAVPLSALVMFGIAVLMTLALAVVSRRTTFGLAMTAVAESQTTTAILGRSTDLVASVTWAVGAMLAGIGGILIVPLSGLTVTGLTLTIVAAMAASMAGGFSSFWLTLLFGTVLGVAQSETANYAPGVIGLGDGLTFLLIVVILVGRRQSLSVRSHLFERLPRLGTGVLRPKATLAVSAVLLVLMLVVFPSGLLAAASVQLSLCLVLLGVVIVTGYAGQLSLGTYAIAGIGAFFAARLFASAHWPFLACLLAGVLGSFVVGAAIGVISLRTRGVSLAVATLGFALAVYSLLFSNSSYTGGLEGVNVGGPTVFGLSVDPVAYPVRYAIFCLIVFTAAAIAVANLRRGRAGRRMIAVRANARAASSLGISVAGTKLWAFAISSAFAGLGGALLGFQSGTIVFTAFDPLTSINSVAWSTIGSIGSVVGPVPGSALASGSVVGYFLNQWGSLAPWLTIIAGVSTLLILIQNPDGIVLGIAEGRGDPLSRWIVRRLRQRQTPATQAQAPQFTSIRDDLAVRTVHQAGLTVEGLTVRYGGVTAVSGLDLTVEPGQVVGLVGPNGAGKTSVIDAVTGFAKSSAGRVRLGDRQISGMPAHRRAAAGITRSFQSVELFDDLTVRENLQAASDRRDLRAWVTTMVSSGGGELPDAAMTVVEIFGITELLDRKPSELSYASRRLVGIARAVVTLPSVLLLDEPAAGLDERETAGLGELIGALAQRFGIGILLVEHDMSLVMSVCHRVVVLDFGECIAQGTPTEIQSDARVIEAYLGASAETDEVRRIEEQLRNYASSGPSVSEDVDAR